MALLEPLVNAKLSPVTKKIYLDRWKILNTAFNEEIDVIIMEPEKYIKWIKKTYDSLPTQKSYISAILTIFRYNPEFKKKNIKIYEQWYEEFKKIHGEIDAILKQNAPTKRQKDAYIPFENIVKKRDELIKGSFERLILAFYTYIPPLRCDLNKVRIYTEKNCKGIDKQDKHLEDCDSKKENYVLLDTKKHTGKLILNEYKTAHSLNKYEKELPKELISELEESLKKYDREYLFVDRKGDPYIANSYTRWVNRILQKLFNTKITVSLIRHAYINTLDFNKLTIQEKEDIAKDMAHSVDTQARYKWMNFA